MSLTFSHDTLGQRVLFGNGKAANFLQDEVVRLGAERIMLIASPRELERATLLTKDLPIAATFTDVVMHVPVEKAQAARELATSVGADLLMCMGGGSATGFAKSVALETGAPIIAIPTTFSGSEATNVWGMTEDDTKVTGVDPRVLPTTVIYDSEFTKSMPTDMAIASGLNALAHCVDSMWAPKANPINQAFAIEATRALNEGLSIIAADPESIDGHDQTLYGAYLAAVSFASAGSGIHHKLCHILGGTFNMPHAQTHATVLPYALAFNAPNAPEASARLAQAFKHTDAVQGLLELKEKLDAPRALKDFGFTKDNIPEAVERALKAIPESNPTTPMEENLTELFTKALDGVAPQ